MKLSKEQVQSILDDIKPSIIEGLKQEVISQTKWENKFYFSVGLICLLLYLYVCLYY